MSKLQVCFILILILFIPSIVSAGIVYNNLDSPIDIIHGGGVTEYGDQVTLAGTERILTEILIAYRGNFLDHGLDGDEFVSVHFYHNDGPAGAPGTQFYASGLIPVLSPAGTTTPQAFGGVISAVLPNVEAPDTFTWALKRFGMSPGGTDQVALYAGGSPTFGASADFCWFNNVVSGWYQIDFAPNAQANYHAMILAQDDPVEAAEVSWGALKSIYR